MHAADAAGAEEPDAEQPADRQRPADRGRAQGALHQARGQIAGTDLTGRRARLGEALECRAAQPGQHGAVRYPDGGRRCTRRPDPLLGSQRGLQALPAGETMRYQGGLQRHDRTAEPQCLSDLWCHLRLDCHGIAPILATALAAACRPRLIPPSR